MTQLNYHQDVIQRMLDSCPPEDREYGANVKISVSGSSPRSITVSLETLEEFKNLLGSKSKGDEYADEEHRQC